MAASGSLAYAQIAAQPCVHDISVYNSSGADIAAFTGVMLDTSHLMESTDLSLNMLGAKVAIATAGQVMLGLTCEIIPAGGTGRVRTGGIGVGIAYGTITANTWVGSSGTTAGSLDTKTAASAYLGQALATVATTELFPVLINIGTGA
jgi:hypothetical protein